MTQQSQVCRSKWTAHALLCKASFDVRLPRAVLIDGCYYASPDEELPPGGIGVLTPWIFKFVVRLISRLRACIVPTRAPAISRMLFG